jgi:hypothetical protein
MTQWLASFLNHEYTQPHRRFTVTTDEDVAISGHEESAGHCTFDRALKAIIDYTRQLGYQTVVTIGASMGGATGCRPSGHMVIWMASSQLARSRTPIE